MILQTNYRVNKKNRMKELVKRREELRHKLKDHFCLSVSERDYHNFEKVIDELDEIRSLISKLKG